MGVGFLAATRISARPAPLALFPEVPTSCFRVGRAGLGWWAEGTQFPKVLAPPLSPGPRLPWIPCWALAAPWSRVQTGAQESGLAALWPAALFVGVALDQGLQARFSHLHLGVRGWPAFLSSAQFLVLCVLLEPLFYVWHCDRLWGRGADRPDTSLPAPLV